MIGKILGNRYRVLREIGSGGMAWVYLAEDINEGRLVAIKVLYPQFGEDLAYIQRFNREAKLASTLSDPHVVRVLDYGATRDVHYLVMEYIEGQDLRGVIDEQGSLPWREALQLLDQLAMALEHAHLHGVVHRDVKPQNMMITGDGTLKVLDFGIARARMLPSLTQSGFVGSPYYISPEQAMGEEVDIRSDIYSTGVVLYEMLSGRVPYDAASPWSIISQHIASEPPSVGILGNQIPGSMETLLRRMIAKRREDRFQTPSALREAIASVLDGRDLPETLDLGIPEVRDRAATAEGLFQRALQATQEEDWQRAVDLLNQVVKLNPKHADATERLAHAGIQARLAALYAAARRAMEGGRWQEVVDELGEVISVDPDYRDAADLLARARLAQQGQDVAQAVSDLYTRGASYVELGEWEDAARCLRQVQQLSPGYKKTQALLAEAERHLRWGRLRLPGMRIASSRVVPILALVFLLLVIGGGIYLVGQRNSVSNASELSTRVSKDPAQVYNEAQDAMDSGDWARAIEMLDALLAQDPNFEDAGALREMAETNRALEGIFQEGQAAYSVGRWDEAIEVLIRVSQADSSFRTDEVQEILCDAYLEQGWARVANGGDVLDMASMEAAFEDFEAGLAICPDSRDQSAQQVYARRIQQAMKAQSAGELDTVVQELSSVLASGPDFAEPSARLMLYTTLSKRGDARQKTGDLAGALSDYEQALALNDIDPLGVAPRRDGVAEELDSVALPEPPRPGETPTANNFKYTAPILIGPEDDALFQGELTPVVLQWEPVGALAADEYYDVTVMHQVGGEERYWGGPVKETQWQVPVEAGLGEAANDRFFWWVTVRKAHTAPGAGQLDLPLSPKSETGTFIWAE